MLLAIDAGNTHVVVGVYPTTQVIRRGDNLEAGSRAVAPLASFRISTHPIGTDDELRIKLGKLLELESLSISRIEKIMVSSVVPQFTEILFRAFPRHEIHSIGMDGNTPFSFRIVPGAGVGADRLVNAEAVAQEFGGPAVIVDSGTATTVCALNEKREYLGGAIIPGMELSLQALAKNAAQLFTVDLVAPARVIGNNTTDAIRSGVLYGYASMIDGMVARFQKELNAPSCPVIATGGVSRTLRGLTQSITHFDPDLTLKGILYLYDAIENKKRKDLSHVVQ